MHYIKTTCVTALYFVIATTASADVIHISTGSDSFDLNSIAYDGLFDTPSGNFSSNELASVHETLNSWGIDTDGLITILPLSTNAGLSLLTLVDQELGFGDNGNDASIALSTTAPSSLGMYINDYEQDIWTLIDPPFGSQTMGTLFVWGGNGSGDGFAWTGLSIGDAISYNFVDDGTVGGALSSETFQFVGWAESGWDVVSTNGFKLDGTSVFTGIVIPAPPVALALLTYAFGYRRRRR